MRGQLWQECLDCETEPVCIDCERCERHCSCTQDAEDRRQMRDFEKAYPGLLNKVQRHYEDGEREH